MDSNGVLFIEETRFVRLKGIGKHREWFSFRDSKFDSLFQFSFMISRFLLWFVDCIKRKLFTKCVLIHGFAVRRWGTGLKIIWVSLLFLEVHFWIWFLNLVSETDFGISFWFRNPNLISDFRIRCKLTNFDLWFPCYVEVKSLFYTIIVTSYSSIGHDRMLQWHVAKHQRLGRLREACKCFATKWFLPQRFHVSSHLHRKYTYI